MNFKSKFHFFSLLILFIFVLSNFGFATTLKETFKKQLSCDGKPALEVKNSNGRIEVFSWDKDEVKIIAHIKVEGSESSAKRMLDRIEIEIEQDGNDIFVETLVPKGMHGNGGIFSWLFGDSRFSYSVNYEISVPVESDLNLHTTNGRVSVEEVSGKIKMNSTNGKINARDVSGIVRCETTNGSVRAEIKEITSDEEMTFRTTNGSIKLYLPEEYGGYAELKTSNGHIDSDFRLSDGRKNYRRSRNSYRGDFGDGDGSITCKTTNGSIYLLKND
jgi:putative adhesin